MKRIHQLRRAEDEGTCDTVSDGALSTHHALMEHSAIATAAKSCPEAILATMSDAVITFDGTGRIVSMNPAVFAVRRGLASWRRHAWARGAHAQPAADAFLLAETGRPGT